MFKKTLYLFLLSFSILSCQSESGKKEAPTVSANSGIIVADTILYPVDIINLDTTNTWASSRLRNLEHQKLINLLFEAVYEGKAQALDYYNREPIPVEKVKEMESSGKFDRSQTAQLQFEETWRVDPQAGTMTKDIQSVLLAWPVLDREGNLQAYQAGFVIKLNH